MKRLFHLVTLATVAAVLMIGCEKENPSPVDPDPQQGDTTNYLAFSAVEAGATVSMEIVGQCEAPSLEYSTDLKKWTKFDFSKPQTITLKNVGDKVYWRNTGKTDTFSPADDENYIHFNLGSKKIAASGNIMSLLDSECEMTEMPEDVAFIFLFRRDSMLVSAPELPATKLSAACYYGMFVGCKSLEETPALPAVELSEFCYYSMFYECTSIKRAPELPATTLAPACYFQMFALCESLEEAPALPASNMVDHCYTTMFYCCTSLKKAPALPSKNLAPYCYCTMFSECTSLKEAPVLPATDLTDAPYCYRDMFGGCTALEQAPELPATTLSTRCYSSMFNGCSNLDKIPGLPATELAEKCYFQMFIDCTHLTEAPELPATELKNSCYEFMFCNTALEEAPALPATSLTDSCYLAMFQECAKLKKAPELPATKMYTSCYQQMFLGCESLETVPELPATEMAEMCYGFMFYDCSNLNHIKVAFNDWEGGEDATYDWVYGVGSEGAFECPEGHAVQYGDSFIPNGWSVNGAAPAAVNKIVKMRRELGNPGKAARYKAACEKNGWIPVSMRDEWWTIYGPQVERN